MTQAIQEVDGSWTVYLDDTCVARGLTLSEVDERFGIGLGEGQ